ncbi:uroporphyrinogen-III synthase [Staphylococcus felis]|uniref:Uroporphyrinogen-III synthase n=1 Tax=Staphylococcus felis TaxID=46127 RepID=A0AAX1RXJ4_9STAP|nr:uroporphyrinogen-III synthase [Staphylococcus felis]MBH9580931.1 uroporphyrinogen-III synthase [Staphylococcus felis]MDM8327615.1 uroporphyrinogen-III synthase [Staphylococcus felis]REH78900.1 uroporphyrinogen-III synthase [Staphylococcus felis]REH83094.1 uroporphyrinogen-III synthase [Staphylococcus felis]REH85389.1 uroporphyrinogen-III synthase [Staphylococcus felis]
MKPTVVMTQTKMYTNQSVNIVHLPLIETKSLSFDIQVLGEHYQWLLFSSQNAVRHFFPYMSQVSYEKVAVIGIKTAQMCEKYGIKVDFIPHNYSQEGFLESFNAESSDKILIPSSKGARPLLNQSLRQRGHSTCKIDLYESAPHIQNVQKVYRLINQGCVDVITFASSSAVNAFFDYEATLVNQYDIVTIGSQTRQTVEDYGMQCKTADIQTLDAMIEKIIETRD